MTRHDPDERSREFRGPYANERERLVPMSTLESWTMSDGDPDIRGWEVRTLGGRRLGTIADLLIDAAEGEAILLDIDLSASDRRTFVPVRMVLLDRVHEIVLMDSADLPEGDSPRDDRARAAGGRSGDAGVVRYPARDREVSRGRPQPADTGFQSAPPASDRRRTERRRIDRMSSEF